MSGESHQPTAPRAAEQAETQYQRTKLPVGLILACVGALIGLMLFAIVFAGGLFGLLEWNRQPIGRTSLETAEIIPPQPRLEASPQGDRIAIEAQAKARLEGYAWTDRAAGRVRIPIQRAMKIVADQGWPDPDGKVRP